MEEITKSDLFTTTGSLPFPTILQNLVGFVPSWMSHKWGLTRSLEMHWEKNISNVLWQKQNLHRKNYKMGMKLQEEGIFSKKGLHESSGYQRWRGLIKWKGGIDILYQ